MYCPKCGTEVKEGAKFCNKCGTPIQQKSLDFNDKINKNKIQDENKTKTILIVAVAVIICVAIVAGTFILLNGSNEGVDSVNTVNSQPKSWKLVSTYSGSGSGSESYTLPVGELKVNIYAFPIKNYATNHLYVSSDSFDSMNLDWGPKDAVESKSDSVSFTTTGPDSIYIDFYELENWKVEIYQYC